jgi:hypothetical protein
MPASKETSRATTKVRGTTLRGFSGGVTAAARYRKSLETRLRNLTGKKAAQGFLNRTEERMFRHLTRIMRSKRIERVGVTISVRFLPPRDEGAELQKSTPILV